MLRVYNFTGEYSRIWLYDCMGSFAMSEGEVGRLTFGKVMDFIMEINSDVVFCDKKYRKNGLKICDDKNRKGNGYMKED